MAAPALRLDEDPGDLGIARLDLRFEGADRLLDLARRQRIGKIDTDVEQDVGRAEMHGQQLVQLLDALVAGEYLPDPGYD